MKMGSRKGKRVPAMNTAKVTDSRSEVEMNYFDANGVEEKTAGTDVEPYLFQVQLGDDFDPDLCREFGDATVSVAAAW